MRRTTAWLTVATLFLVGVLVGLLTERLVLAERPMHPRHGGPMGGPRFHERLFRQLDLTEDQRGELERILAESREKSESIRQEMLPRLHRQMEVTRQRIEEILTPEQRETMRRLHERHRRGSERFFLGRR